LPGLQLATCEFRDLCWQRPFHADALRVSYAGNPKLLGSIMRSLKRLSCSNRGTSPIGL